MTTQIKTKGPLEVKNGIEGRGVFATQKINKNTIIFKMHGEFFSSPTQTSVQIGDTMHIEDDIAGLVNHSCHPTARVDRPTQTFVSLRDINEGEEITFDYTMNEDKLAAPFICKCCGEVIKGKKF